MQPMAKLAGGMCEYAQVSTSMSLAPRPPSADDLLVLLAVARAGRYTAAAAELGLNHTTIAPRRLPRDRGRDEACGSSARRRRPRGGRGSAARAPGRSGAPRRLRAR